MTAGRSLPAIGWALIMGALGTILLGPRVFPWCESSQETRSRSPTTYVAGRERRNVGRFTVNTSADAVRSFDHSLLRPIGGVGVILHAQNPKDSGAQLNPKI